MPLVLARRGVDGHHRAREEVVSGTEGPVLRGRAAARVAERHVVQAELGIHRAVHPRRRAAFLSAVGAVGEHGTPRLRRVEGHPVDPGELLPALRSTEEVPQIGSVARVERDDGSAVAVRRVGVDDSVEVHGRDFPDASEILTLRADGLLRPYLLARGLVERDHAVAACQREDLAIAGRDATPCARQAVDVVLPLPDGITRRAVDGDHAATRRVDVDHPVDDDGGGLLPDVIGCRRDRRHVRTPGGCEILQVLLRDLRQPRIVLVAEVATDGGHVGAGRFEARQPDGRDRFGGPHQSIGG